MGLSEHEQRMLDAIEQGLYEEDPKFATSINPARLRRRRPIVSAVIFVIGLVALVVGVIATQAIFALGIAVSVVGFLIMVAAVGLFVFGLPGAKGVVGGAHPSKAGSPLTDRMEERFRRRFEDN